MADQPANPLQNPAPQNPSPAASYNLVASGNGASGNGQHTQAVLGAPAPAAPAAPTLSALLGPKPIFSARALEEVEARRKKTAKTVFFLSALILLGAYGFFYSQLNPDFTWLNDQLGPNVAARFESSNSELKAKQTERNLINYRMARLLIDEVNSQIDPFQRQTAIKNSSFATVAQKQNAELELQILGASIKKTLGDTQKILALPLGIDIYTREPIAQQAREAEFENLLKAQLGKERAALTSDSKPNTVEIRLIENVLRLVENKSFRSTLLAQDLGKISEDAFSGMLAKIREEGSDELSAIDKVKVKRLDWGSVISDIHAVTTKADPFYGQGLFKTVGGFLFSSYRFDAKSGRISISGLTKRSDSKVFSAIAELVDAIEKSPKFKDIEFRSFSKSKDDSGDYSSSVNLEFTLQTGKDQRDSASNPNS
jgi:hypothetical protein